MNRNPPAVGRQPMRASDGTRLGGLPRHAPITGGRTLVPHSPSNPDIQAEIFWGVRTKKGKLRSGEYFSGPTS
jgi:hypothetical protein